MELLSGCVVKGSWSVNFWLLFCKLLRGLLNWIYSSLCGSLGKERMAMGEMEAIYKLKYFIFLSTKKHRENGNSTGKMQGIWYWLERGNPGYTLRLYFLKAENHVSLFIFLNGQSTIRIHLRFSFSLSCSWRKRGVSSGQMNCVPKLLQSERKTELLSPLVSMRILWLHAYFLTSPVSNLASNLPDARLLIKLRYWSIVQEVSMSTSSMSLRYSFIRGTNPGNSPSWNRKIAKNFANHHLQYFTALI